MTPPSISIEASFDCTQRQLVTDIAWKIYARLGCKAPAPTEEPDYFWKSQHPTEKAVLAAAEEIFELFWGDSPDYSDEDED